MRELEELDEQLRRVEHKLTDEERKKIHDRLGYVREALSLLDEKYSEAIRDRSIVHSLLERTSEDLLNQYRAIFENAGSAMVVLDHDGTIALSNSSFEKLAGLPRNQLENMRRFAEVADHELITLVDQYLARKGKDGSEVPNSGEGQITSIGGKISDVYLRIGRFPETGQCVLSILDITARKRAEEELLKNREYLAQIFSSLQAGIMIIDASTHTIIDVNDAASNLIGLDRLKIIGNVCHGFVCQAQVGKCPITDNNQTVDDAERVLVNSKGVPVPIIKHVVPLMLHGRSCLLETFIDNTDRKRAEEALKMVNRKLTLLSSITRHDISNQIMVIDGFLSLIQMRSNEPEIKNLCNKIESANRNIRNQVEFTKDYENLGKNEPKWQAMQQALAFQPIPDNIKTDYQVEGLSIYADPMIDKVFFNFIDNSVRHGGHVSRFCLFYTESVDGLTIVWEDDGVGVPIGDKEHIFERGFGKNTGLGLFLVREILSLTGMSIRETGKEGVGVRFEILVPRGSYRFSEQ